MPTIQAAAGHASANSYAEVADADTYFDERLQASNWTGEADADVKERALIQATRQLDQYDFVGTKTSTGQALKWPRQDAFDEDGEEYATDSVPTIIQHATFELALKLLNDNAASTDTLAPTGLEQFKRAKVGPVEVEVDRAHRTSDLPDHVMLLIGHVLRSAGMVATLERA